MKVSTDIQIVVVIFCLILLQLALVSASSLNLAGDEAYYWMWSRKLDFSYYEKGPGIAYLIAVTSWLFGDTELGVRFGAVFCQLLLALSLYFFTLKQHSRSQAIFLLGMMFSSLSFGTLGIFMTCDPPMCLFWALSLIAAVYAVQKDRPWIWILALTAVGLGALFKYSTFILIPSYLLFLVFTPTRKRHLWSSGFIVGSLIAVLLLSPVVYWNSQHNWANIAANTGHFNAHKSHFKLAHVAELVFGQWGLVGLIQFPLVMLALYRGVQCWRSGDMLAGLYVCSSIPLALVCFVLSFYRSVYANWPMPLFIGALLLTVHLLRIDPIFERKTIWFKRSIALNAFFLATVHLLFTGYCFGIPPRFLPSNKLVGWKLLGQTVDQLIDNQSFVIVEKYMIGSEIGFYSRFHPIILVHDPDVFRTTQFNFWAEGAQLQHHQALLVFQEPEEWLDFRRYFENIEPAAIPQLEIPYGSQIQRKFYLYQARNFIGTNLSTVHTLNDTPR
jgi:4-amino-4-deoxy-L-arabinose transferase-like glycosyltransferase